MTEPRIPMEPTLEARLAILRMELPTCYSDRLVPFKGRVTIDLEWERDHPEILKLIGVGNREHMTQLHWQRAGTDAQRSIREWLLTIALTQPVVYHNAVADIRVLRMHGFAIAPAMHLKLDDTMLADAALFAEEDHDLGDVARRHGGGVLPEWKDLSESHPDLYNAADLLAPILCMEALEAWFVRDPRAEHIYRSQSLPLLQYIIEGEERGVAVDAEVAFRLKAKFDQRCEEAQRLAQAYSGYPINLGSPDQLMHSFYVVEGLPIQWDKKSRFDEEPKATTDKDALAALRRLHGTEWDEDDESTLETAVQAIEDGGHPMLEARYLYYGAQQARSHYVAPCLEWDEKDNVVGAKVRIYPETRIHAQASGRHSIVGPPLTQFKRENFKLIKPDPGWPWFGFDWSNIETWLLGYLAGDELILKAKEANWDTHVVNFCDLAGISYPPILTKSVHKSDAPECVAWRDAIGWTGDDDIRRTFAKRAVFRTHYRGNPEGMGDIPGAKALKMDAERMTAAVNRYLDKHHWIREFWKRIEHAVDTEGVVYTWDGRPRRMTGTSVNARYREASNHPLQGGVAGIYNQTYLEIKRLLPDARFVTGAFDAQWWALPEDLYDVYSAVIMAVAQRHYTINGQDAFFPASAKEKRVA